MTAGPIDPKLPAPVIVTLLGNLGPLFQHYPQLYMYFLSKQNIIIPLILDMNAQRE